MPSRYSWNLNNNVSRRPCTPNPPPQIACRICNHVFMSTQALIDHIETHMKEDDYYSSSSRTRHPPLASGGHGGGGSLINLMNTQRNNCPLTIFPSMSSPSSTTLPVFNPNTITLPSFQERNPTFNPVPPSRLAPPPRFPPYMGLRNNNNNTVGLQQFLFPLLQAAPKKAIEEKTNSDCTKPFLQMLDKPFPYIHADQSNKSDLDLLDLTLKL